MDRLEVDLGLQEFALGSGTLRFNPTDPNLYQRFLELEPQLQALRQELITGSCQLQDAAGVLQMLSDADRKFKELLTWVFGPENDFSRLLGSVNLFSTGAQGRSVAENLLSALEPVLTRGAEQFVEKYTQAALEKARLRRENQ